MPKFVRPYEGEKLFRLTSAVILDVIISYIGRCSSPLVRAYFFKVLS